ncbi:hypothetical protein GCM10023170_059930 [Phytohabitans houttuyneae]|uniref:Muconolactone isomerase domain-containing protein n=2 Tax=Phytohabitans houttuyneae TaxID=1076126 RepID=A0A6V8KG38_9ACTN|nr:hypothetical protein Phou_055280 [Phytohabitans houttuyneae]
MCEYRRRGSTAAEILLVRTGVRMLRHRHLAARGDEMRVLMKAEFDTEAGNRAIKEGRLSQVLGATMEQLKPEAAYFTTINGHRGAFIVFDLNDPSDIPMLAEPLFVEMGAKIELLPVMNVDDVQSGLSKWQQASGA